MTPEEIDLILRSADEGPEPSPAFTHNVMLAVQTDAPEIRPPFPWVRFGAGLVASTVMAATGTVLLQPQTAALTIPPSATQTVPAISMAIFALLICFTFIAAPRLLTRE